MNKYAQEYRTIARELINKSFPTLKNKRIIVTEIPWYFGVVGTSTTLFFFELIAPTRKARKLSKKAKIGMLAHELMHSENHQKLSFLKLIYLGFMYYLSRKVYAKEERETELAVLKRGYAKELLQLTTERERVKTKEQIAKRHKKGYLSIEEIKQYMKKHNIKIK